MNTPKTDQLWSELEQLGWKRDHLPVSKIMASHEALEIELASHMPTEQNGLSQSNATDHPTPWHPFCDGPLYYPCLVTDGTNVETKGKPRKKTWVFSHAKLRLIPTHWMPLPIPPSNQDDLQELRDFASKNVKMKDTAENGPRKHSDL